MITFDSDERFELVDTGQRCPEMRSVERRDSHH
jgi:hypothetical protein